MVLALQVAHGVLQVGNANCFPGQIQIEGLERDRCGGSGWVGMAWLGELASELR
jgi:hypothetical protein